MSFRRVFWRPPVEDEVREEVAFHIEMRARELVARGMDAADARREAERRFGSAGRTERTLRGLGLRRNRHMQRTQYAGELLQDIAFTARQMRKQPGFTAIAVLTLALGIGGTTAIFSILNAVVLHPIPLREPDRLLMVGETYRGDISSMSVGNYIDAAAGTSSLEGLAAENFASFNLSDGATPERVLAGAVTANFFDVMGARPALGRVFTSEEDRPGQNLVVVLSDRLWTRRFGADRSIVGRTIRMNGVNYLVAGVMPASFDLTSDSDELWTPIAFTPEQRVLHDEHYLTVYGRLKPGATRERLQAELDAVAARLRREFPQDASTLTYRTQPFGEQFVGDSRGRLLVLLGAVVVVLLIACGNVANLLLARGTARGREIAVRVALGAGRGRIVRQLLTESIVIALAAAAAGVALASWAAAALVASAPEGVPRIEQAQVDATALAFAVAIALVSSILCGVAPALQLARTDVQTALRDGGRGATGGGRRDRLRRVLIAAEVALSLLLLIGAGLLIRSAIAMQRVNPGFDPAGVLTARFTLPETVYADPVREQETLRRISDTVAHLPGVSGAAVSSYVAMGGGGGTNGLVPEGWPNEPHSYINSTLRLTTPGFFAAMRTPLLKGRSFTDDDRDGTQRVMIVSAALAARAFPGQDPLGKRINCCEPGPNGAKVIIGVAADIRSRGPAVAPDPEFYLPMTQPPRDVFRWYRTFWVVLRTEHDPQALGEPLRAAIAGVDRDLPIFDVRTMNQRLVRTLATARFNTMLLSLLGGIGLVLAAIGIYGVVAYVVSQRTQEIGVRIALGANTSAVIRLILGQAMKPVAAGAAVGVAAALGATRVLSSQLYEVSPTDPWTIAAVVATLVSVALVASALPARRAATTDPTRALQSE